MKTVANALQKRREVRVGERNADRFHDFAADLLEARGEGGFPFDAWGPIVDQRNDVLAAVLGRPFSQNPGLRGQNETRTNEIRRLRRRDRGARGQDQRGFLRFCGERRDRERGRRSADAQHVDLFADDHLLDQPARIIGDAAVIADDQLNLAAGHSVAVLLHIKLQRGLQLSAPGAEAGAGQWHADADFERRVSGRGTGKQSARGGHRHSLKHGSAQHKTSSPFYVEPARTAMTSQ